jgi:hypothetical protein
VFVSGAGQAGRPRFRWKADMEKSVVIQAFEVRSFAIPSDDLVLHIGECAFVYSAV